MLEQILQDLERDGFCYLEKILTSEELLVLNRFFDERKEAFLPAKVGTTKERLEAIRGDYTYWVDALDPEPPLDALVSKLTVLREAVNRKFFLGLREFECHLAFYPPGTFYKKHLDRFESKPGRRLSFIFYLNLDWDDANGGELELFDREGTYLRTFYPRPGSFVCFLSDEFPHEVRPASRERRSFTGWMHTKIIY